MTKLQKKLKKIKNKLKDRYREEELKLVVSDEFVERYSKCKQKSCMSKQYFNSLQFYKDNGCKIATLETKDGFVIGRTILWNKYWFEFYVIHRHDGVFKRVLKNAGFRKTKRQLIYPLKKVAHFPYLDGMEYFNKDCTAVSNFVDDDFCIKPESVALSETNLLSWLGMFDFSCWMCGRRSSLAMHKIEGDKIKCAYCGSNKDSAIKFLNNIKNLDPKPYMKRRIKLKIEPLKLPKKTMVFNYGDRPLVD